MSSKLKGCWNLNQSYFGRKLTAKPPRAIQARTDGVITETFSLPRTLFVSRRLSAPLGSLPGFSLHTTFIIKAGPLFFHESDLQNNFRIRIHRSEEDFRFIFCISSPPGVICPYQLPANWGVQITVSPSEQQIFSDEAPYSLGQGPFIEIPYDNVHNYHHRASKVGEETRQVQQFAAWVLRTRVMTAFDINKSQFSWRWFKHVWVSSQCFFKSLMEIRVLTLLIESRLLDRYFSLIGLFRTILTNESSTSNSLWRSSRSVDYDISFLDD